MARPAGKLVSAPDRAAGLRRSKGRGIRKIRRPHTDRRRLRFHLGEDGQGLRGLGFSHSKRASTFPSEPGRRPVTSATAVMARSFTRVPLVELRSGDGKRRPRIDLRVTARDRGIVDLDEVVRGATMVTSSSAVRARSALSWKARERASPYPLIAALATRGARPALGVGAEAPVPLTCALARPHSAALYVDRADPQFLHHRAYRSREDHAFRSIARAHRHDSRSRHGRINCSIRWISNASAGSRSRRIRWRCATPRRTAKNTG